MRHHLNLGVFSFYAPEPKLLNQYPGRYSGGYRKYRTEETKCCTQDRYGRYTTAGCNDVALSIIRGVTT